jgi:hypothetical protein
MDGGVMATPFNYLGPPPQAGFIGMLSRLRPGQANADPSMVASPYANGGDAMPNADLGNLNQMPGQVVSGWLQAGLAPEHLATLWQIPAWRDHLMQQFGNQQGANPNWLAAGTARTGT